jgi:hypothetical protein
MTSDQKELFRVAVLRVFAANKTRFGLGLPAVAHLATLFGFTDVAPEETAEAVEYLEHKQLLAEVPKTISPENRAWRITPAGVAFLDERD